MEFKMAMVKFINRNCHKGHQRSNLKGTKSNIYLSQELSTIYVESYDL